jgi:2-C-methyl-D-erythritol 4-phosphate cytidylyltransferase
MNIGVILPAGGGGKRLCASQPKQFLDVEGKSLLQYSLEVFNFLPEVTEISLVLPVGYINDFNGIVEVYSKVKLVAGGDERWESVKNGFMSFSADIKGVLIHDVARPFVPLNVIRRSISLVNEGKSSIAALKATDTIKKVSGGDIRKTLDRTQLIEVQTPQAFPREVMEAIYSQDISACPAHLKTDEAGLAEFLGYKVCWVEGHPLLRKVTGPYDLSWARWVAGQLKEGGLSLND